MAEELLEAPPIHGEVAPPVGRHDDPGLLRALVGDGRPLLSFVGLALVLSGGFAMFLAADGHFLPHDEEYLGMTAGELCRQDQCRIVHFMYHDRGSFGGALIAIGTLYLWLAAFPLREPRAVGVVDVPRQRPGGVRQLPGVPRLRLSRHVARRRDAPAAAVLRVGADRAPTARSGRRAGRGACCGPACASRGVRGRASGGPACC